jgi:short-subunit dehydrogenase
MANDHYIERLKETSSHINTLLTLIPCDLSNVDNILEFVPQLPKLDGVIFCAGIAEYLPVKFINKNKMQNIFSVNFDSQVILTQQLIKHKKLNNNSSLVYVSSIG